MKIEIPEKAKIILNTIHNAGFEAYVVGGCVRDSILGRIPGDWDITTSAKPQDIKKLFKRTIDTGIEHGTVTVMMGKDGYEVTTYRIDGEYSDNRHPKEVTFTASLRQDMERRDFTINAMAYNDEEGLIDNFGGIEDIEKKVIRCVGNPRERFGEDALRIMRAIRFSAQLGYDIDENTKIAIKELAPTLEKISAERIQVELVKMLTSKYPEKLLDAYKMGITKVILPEFDICMATPQNTKHHCYNVGEHIVKSIQNVEADRLLRLTMLFHDIGKPKAHTIDEKGNSHFIGHEKISADMAKTIMRRLKFDRDTMDRVCNLVKYHDIRFKITPAKVRMSIYKVGEKDYPLMFKVKRADTLAQSNYMRNEKLEWIDDLEKQYEKIVEEGDCLSLKTLSVKGNDLVSLGIKPGKQIGDTLMNMLRDVLNEPSHNTKEYLLEPVNLKRFMSGE
ncbi:MAG: CCA tRNA nucleotidyltransferase [Butyrivibrio sp.]|nr:CCA tRNA nucleotidyltransferase [Butyrivibrio sp.]